MHTCNRGAIAPHVKETIATAREVLAGVDLLSAGVGGCALTVGWLEFQHAATTGDWSGAGCDERSAVKSPRRGGCRIANGRSA